MVLSENQALMILNALPNIGPCKAKSLFSYFRGDVKSIFSSTSDHLKQVDKLNSEDINLILNNEQFFNLKEEENKLARIRGQFFGISHTSYPAFLKEIYDAPIGIYSIGELNNCIKNIGIVGSRTSTLYGLETARNLAIALAKRGFCIVSGMARGIDSSAHEGTLAVGGKTIAVLGSGIDVVYPQENAMLYKKIAENGAIISEFPLGRRADKQTFPMRNRIIAGMCHAIIVVESDIQGGSLITAKYAAEYGRRVFAVPGRIDQRSSAGCLSLIKNGATMLTCVEDIFEDLPYLDNTPQQGILPLQEDEKPQAEISCPMERKVYEILSKEKSLTRDSVIEQSGLPASKAMYSLQMLEIRGLIAKRYDGMFEISNKR